MLIMMYSKCEGMINKPCSSGLVCILNAASLFEAFFYCRSFIVDLEVFHFFITKTTDCTFTGK